MKKWWSLWVFLWMGLHVVWAQPGQHRDALRVGYTQVYLAQEGTFKPGAYLDYSRLFYPPLYLSVGAHFTQAKDLEDDVQIRDLLSISIDLHAHYAFLDTRNQQLKLGFGLSARLFETQWLEKANGAEGTTSIVRPGIAFSFQYDHFFDAFLVGFQSRGQVYNNEGAIYWIGGHLGFRF